MTDIDTLITELRARVDSDEPQPTPTKADIRALLDHIDEVTRALEFTKASNDVLREVHDKAEAELALLRAPVEGEVGEVVKDLEAASADLIQRTYSDRCGSPQCAIASNVATRAAELIQRLAGQVAEARERTEREVSATRADAWAERTARIAAEARLREAVEVINAWMKADYIGIGVGIKNTREAARAFLSTLEDHSNG